MRRAASLLMCMLFTVVIGAVGVYPADASHCGGQARWYAIFQNDMSSWPKRGGHGQIQKSPITVGENRVSIHTNWVITALNTGTPYNIAWAEIGWGYNAVFSGHGPDWFYYYYRVNGSEAYYYPLQNAPSASPDGGRHAIAIKWTSGGGTYRGYIDNVEVMFATGLGDGGVYKHEIGAETGSCHTVFSTAYLSEFTIQNWDATWSYWPSGTGRADPPAWITWSSYPTSGWVGMN